MSERQYPLMRGLLLDPTDVPSGSEPNPAPLPPAVPGTFFPSRREPFINQQGGELDGLLGTMAEGLLVGADAEGHSEIRVTLRDEFFSGTELRISTVAGAVRASLVPPDRDTFRLLSASIDELKERLSARGLLVEDVRVIEP